MDILRRLLEEDQWHRYLRYKLERGHLSPSEEKDLTAFIEERRYIPVVESILRDDPFPHPRRAEISKMHSTKKRVVYIYPKDENYVLKLMTFLILRRYDHLFAPHLYSFRSGRSAKDAIGYLANIPGIGSMWSYKADISDYFNSIPVSKFLPSLQKAIGDDPALFHFLSALLSDPHVYDGDRLITEEKGIMAGTPFSTFLANLYLADLDTSFQEQGVIWARYSDDIILFAPTAEGLDQQITHLHHALQDKGLEINPAKEYRTAPGEKWTFLGFSWHDGTVDIAPASLEKLKGKMRRKARSLARWRDRRNKEGTHAARAFIKVFNRKLFETCPEHDLTWARWYFPSITTDASLRQIDHYAQSCIRWLATGTHTKKAYDFRYEDMKQLGYVSLVNRYYENDMKK